jgi:hypothetical protein
MSKSGLAAVYAAVNGDKKPGAVPMSAKTLDGNAARTSEYAGIFGPRRSQEELNASVDRAVAEMSGAPRTPAPADGQSLDVGEQLNASVDSFLAKMGLGPVGRS